MAWERGEKGFSGMYGSTGAPRADWLPALRRVDDGRMVVLFRHLISNQ
jgi:hypothetical protein